MLPGGAADFLGREDELKLLDDAWSDTEHIQIVELVAPGGVGKTALVKRWLDRLKAEGWHGAQRVYARSFYSQGISEDRQASDDSFLSDALRWFGVEHDPALLPWNKGRCLAEAITATRTLLVLDGVEPLQYPPGPLAGRLRASGLQTLLSQLAGAGQPGLCILTTRERIQDLAEYERCTDHPTGTVICHDLGNLSDVDGARLLYKLGVHHAGAVPIAKNDSELKVASREVRGHALTLSLLGSYLALAYNGDIRHRDQIRFEEADAQIQGGYAFKVMSAYERWFNEGDIDGARQIAILRMLGLFDRPVPLSYLDILREKPPILCLTEVFFSLSTVTQEKKELEPISDKDWRLAINWLKKIRLIDCFYLNSGPFFGYDKETAFAQKEANRLGKPYKLPEPIKYPQPDKQEALEIHPLLREYFAKRMRENLPYAWREAHKRLYHYLCNNTPWWPDGLNSLNPLYQAVAHGCQAELHKEVSENVIVERILRADNYHFGNYSWRSLGAFSSDLSALSWLFDDPWTKLSKNLSPIRRIDALRLASLCLRAIGRIEESIESLQTAQKMATKRQFENRLPEIIGNISEYKLIVGNIDESIAYGEDSVQWADNLNDQYWRYVNRASLADALHQKGDIKRSCSCFKEAENLQFSYDTTIRFLCSQRGFRYCNLLLKPIELEIWKVICNLNFQKAKDFGCIINEVKERANESLEIRKSIKMPLHIGLDKLTIGRCDLYKFILNKNIPFIKDNISQNDICKTINSAIDRLHEAGYLDYLVSGLLTQSLVLMKIKNDEPSTKKVLKDAWQIASRSNMRLHMADIHLHRARLFYDKEELKKSRTLIEQCAYWRRKEELENAEEAAQSW